MTPSILRERLVDSYSFGSDLACTSPAEVKTKSSWISSICYLLRSTQRHCHNPMGLLGDCNIIHYQVLMFLYSRATIDRNFPDWLRGISLIYGVSNRYKHVCNIIWRKFFPMFSHITVPVFGAVVRIYNHPKLIVIEKTIAALLLAAPDIRAQLRQKITLVEGCADQAALNT